MDHLCYSCLVFVMLSRLFIAALWSPARKGLTSWLSFVMFNCAFITFPYGILGKVWCLIVSIPDLCQISNCYNKMRRMHATHVVLNTLTRAEMQKI